MDKLKPFLMEERGNRFWNKHTVIVCSNCREEFAWEGGRYFGSEDFVELWNHGVDCVDGESTKAAKEKT